ncbi:hypothetical protein [uncultured Psychroserpens sp.]|uniref:hypothetical protein n=1 Tax=uncultured Psychroserpens sp. TaxID=255436 RepID=UPI0026179C46|nr:hypothetical protein [uncultured Psychroserpens sp.]
MNSKVTDLSKPRFGFTQTLKNNKIVVGYVWDKDIKSKIAYGDEILKVNGKEINASNFFDFITKESITKHSDQLTLTLKTKDQERLSLTISKKEFIEVLKDFNIEIN